MCRRLRSVGLAWALAGALLVACADEEPGEGTESTTSGSPTSTAATSSPIGTTAPTAGSGSGGSTGTGGATDGGAATTAAPGASGSIAPGPVGGLAAALLRPGHGDRIVVEVRAQAGAEPRTATLDHLLGVLRDVSKKSVSLDGIDALSGGAQQWTAGSIARAADAAAAYPQGGNQVVLRLLFVHGTFEGDDSVLGVAIRGDVAAVFTDQVDAAGGLIVSSADVEDAVTLHEAGHLLGLVDLVLDTGRDDASHPGHSTNQDSVMYWAVESDLIGQVLGGGVPTELDAQDRADLANIRAG